MQTTTETLTKTKWNVDPTHSEITFRVKHLMISNVKGSLRKFLADIESEGDDFSRGKVSATIEANSIFTNEENRDTHLRSADFFDAEKYPYITFNGTSFKKVNEDSYELSGVLSMKGVSKDVTFAVEFGGLVKDPYGNEKAGFSLEGKINRRDFGLNWNAALETGGMLVSEVVHVHAELQFVKKAEGITN